MSAIGDALGAPLAAIAALLIPTFGTNATLITRTKGYIAETDTDVSGPVKRLPIAVTPPDPFTILSQSRGTVVTSDLTLLTAAQNAPAIPQVDDYLLFQGITYRIIQVDPVMSGTETAMWFMYLRK